MRGRTWPGTARPGVRDGPDARTARERRPALLAVADALPVTVLAVIAGAGSFTHIRDTAAQHGPYRLGHCGLHRPDLRHGPPRKTARQAARHRLSDGGFDDVEESFPARRSSVSTRAASRPLSAIASSTRAAISSA